MKKYILVAGVLGLLHVLIYAEGTPPEGFIEYTNTTKQHHEVVVPANKKVVITVGRIRDEPTHLAVLIKKAGEWIIVAKADPAKVEPGTWQPVTTIAASSTPQILSVTGTWNNSQTGDLGGTLTNAAYGRFKDAENIIFSTNSRIDEFNTDVVFTFVD